MSHDPDGSSPNHSRAAPRQRSVWVHAMLRYRRPLILVTVILLGALCLAPSTIAARTSRTKNVSVPKELGIYQSATARKSLTQFSWGVVKPGDVITQTVYLQNRDRTAVTLELVTANWDPLYTQDLFSLQWDLESGHVLAAKAVIPVTFSLIAPMASQNFTEFHFDIIILVAPAAN